MATIRKTTYRCDSCGDDVGAKKELVQIRVEKGSHSRYAYNDNVTGVKADFCDRCENNMLNLMSQFFGEAVYKTLRRKSAKHTDTPVSG